MLLLFLLLPVTSSMTHYVFVTLNVCMCFPLSIAVPGGVFAYCPSATSVMYLSCSQHLINIFIALQDVDLRERDRAGSERREREER